MDEELCQEVDYYRTAIGSTELFVACSRAGGGGAGLGRNCDPATGTNSYIEMYSYTSYGAMMKKKRC